MEQHNPEGCGTCAACLFEKAVKEWETKKKYRVLDTREAFAGHHPMGQNVRAAQEIEDAVNKLDKEGYEMIAVDHGLAFFRAIPPQLPPGIKPIILKASDLVGPEGGASGFDDDDIGTPIK